MKFSQSLITSAVFMATSSIAFAAGDSTDITIQITEDPVVTLEGTLNNNPTPALTLADVTSAATVLGSLGLASNVDGTCDITVTSANAALGGAFKLENQNDLGSGTYLHGTGTYSIDIMGTNYSTTNGAGTSPCTTDPLLAANNVTLNTPALAANVPAGTYSDIITVTVATPF